MNEEEIKKEFKLVRYELSRLHESLSNTRERLVKLESKVYKKDLTKLESYL